MQTGNLESSLPVETSARGSDVKCSEVNKAAVSPRALKPDATLLLFALVLVSVTLANGRVPCLGVDLLHCVASGKKRRSLTRT